MIDARGDLDDRESRWQNRQDHDARPNAMKWRPRTGGRTGDTGTGPGMVRRSLCIAAVRAAGRSAGGFLYSSPFFLSVWPRSWRTGRSRRHHWAPACRTGRTNRRSRRVAYCSRSLSRLATWHGSHTVPPSTGGCVPQRVHVRASRRARSRRLPLSRAKRAAPFRVSAAVWYASRLGLRASCALGLATLFAAMPAQGPIGRGPRLPAPRTHAAGDPLGGNAFIPPPPACTFLLGILVWHVPLLPRL